MNTIFPFPSISAGAHVSPPVKILLGRLRADVRQGLMKMVFFKMLFSADKGKYYTINNETGGLSEASRKHALRMTSYDGIIRIRLRVEVG